MEIVLGVALLKWSYEALSSKAPTKRLKEQADVLQLLCFLVVICPATTLGETMIFACASLGLSLYGAKAATHGRLIRRLPAPLPTMERAKTI